MSRGYFAIGVYHPKREVNIGSLWRSAHLYGASFVFTVGERYKRQASDTPKMTRHTPLFHFDSINDLHDHLPYGAPLVGVELDPRAQRLSTYPHHMAACYLLGAEDHGLPQDVIDKCHDIVQIESLMPQSMNVANAGTLVMYDRFVKDALFLGSHDAVTVGGVA